MKEDLCENRWPERVLGNAARGINLREALNEAVLMLDGTSLLARLVLGPKRTAVLASSLRIFNSCEG